jgi:hypothetical protein
MTRVTMSSNAFVLLLTLAAAVLALWLDHRFPRLCPTRLSNAVLAVIVTGIALHLTLPLTTALINTTSVTNAMIGIIALALPMLALSFLATIWVLKVAVRSLGGTLR